MRLRKSVAEAGFGPLLERYVEPRKIDLDWAAVDEKVDDKMSAPRRYVVTANRHPVVHAYEYPDFIGAYSVSRSALEQFLGIFNHVRDRCYARSTVGGWDRAVKDQRGVAVGYGDGLYAEFRWRDLPLPISALTLSGYLRCTPDEIQFLRLDTSWFDATFEDGFCAIATHLPIMEEISEFLRALTQPAVEAAALKNVLDGVFRDSVVLRTVERVG